jgi:hypothetical protein
MFKLAIESIKERAHLLHDGWTYRGEYLAKPRHNGLAYDRVPKGNIAIFDINTDEECSRFLTPDEKATEAWRIGLEVVPHLFTGMIATIEEFRAFLETISFLGGQKVEGVVIKPKDYALFGVDKKVLMGKFVSEAYREVQSGMWKQDNPKQGDIMEMLGKEYGTAARWHKSIQHLRDAGKLENDPRDIGQLMKEVPDDVKKECTDEIKEKLFKWAWPHIRRMVVRGLPEFYKDQLLRSQFGDENHDVDVKG